MLKVTIFTIFTFSTITNFQAIDFDQDGRLLYTINKSRSGVEMYDVYTHTSTIHKNNKVLYSDLIGHGSEFQLFDFDVNNALPQPKYSFRNKHGYIIFKDWWGRGYGKAIINGVSHKINFYENISGSLLKGSLQGMALNDDYAIFTLSFFSPKSKSLLKNMLYIYNIKLKRVSSYDLKSFPLKKYGVTDSLYIYHEFEGATYHNGKFYIGMKVQVKNSKTLKKIGVIMQLGFDNL